MLLSSYFWFEEPNILYFQGGADQETTGEIEVETGELGSGVGYLGGRPKMRRFGKEYDKKD